MSSRLRSRAVILVCGWLSWFAGSCPHSWVFIFVHGHSFLLAGICLYVQSPAFMGSGLCLWAVMGLWWCGGGAIGGWWWWVLVAICVAVLSACHVVTMFVLLSCCVVAPASGMRWTSRKGGRTCLLSFPSLPFNFIPSLNSFNSLSNPCSVSLSLLFSHQHSTYLFQVSHSTLSHL